MKTREEIVDLIEWAFMAAGGEFCGSAAERAANMADLEEVLTWIADQPDEDPRKMTLDSGVGTCVFCHASDT